MKKVHLYGALSKYGSEFDLDVLTAGEAVSAICANFPGAIDDIRNGSWVIMRGKTVEDGICLDEEAIACMAIGDADIHIMPEVSGAKNSRGLIKAILGVTLIALSFGSAPFLTEAIGSAMFGTATWGNVIGQIGLTMALSGVATMLSPESSSAEEEKSYTMTGPVSQYGQGHAVQIVYGEIITGAMMISGGVDANGLQSITEAPVVTSDPNSVLTDPVNDPATDPSGIWS